MEPSLQRRPRFDHPMVTLGLVTVTLSVLAAFITLRIVNPAEPVDRCAETMGRFRIEMKQTKVPSVFDTEAWDSITNRYNEVFDACSPELAAEFAAKEFNPWAAPALDAMRPAAEEATAPAGSVPAGSETSSPETSIPAPESSK